MKIFPVSNKIYSLKNTHKINFSDSSGAKNLNVYDLESARTLKKTAIVATLGTIATVAGAIGLNLISGIKKKKLVVPPSQPELKLWPVRHYNGEDVSKIIKDYFHKFFIAPISDTGQVWHPYSGKIEKVNPLNGTLVYGPDSRAKTDIFNWMLDELKNAGVNIIDPGDGKKIKYDEHMKKWFEFWSKKPEEQYKKDGRYYAYVVRGIDQIGQPKNRPPVVFPEGAIFKDAPDLQDSCRKFGVMLFYECKNIGKLDPAVIRDGRIACQHLPEPYLDEGVDIWKEYINQLKMTFLPHDAVFYLERTRELLAKKNPDMFKQLEPDLKYTIPYEIPDVDAPLKIWKEYIDKTTEDVNPNLIEQYYEMALKYLRSYKTVPKFKDKILKIREAMNSKIPEERMDYWLFKTDNVMAGMPYVYSKKPAG